MFKVCRKINSRYYSYNLTDEEVDKVIDGEYDRTLTKEYKLDSKTEPSHGKLFAFDSLANVKEYLLHAIDATVFKCKLEKSNLDIKEVALIDFKEFWAKELVATQEVPNGTIFCNWVCITEKVEW